MGRRCLRRQRAHRVRSIFRQPRYRQFTFRYNHHNRWKLWGPMVDSQKSSGVAYPSDARVRRSSAVFRRGKRVNSICRSRASCWFLQSMARPDSFASQSSAVIQGPSRPRCSQMSNAVSHSNRHAAAKSAQTRSATQRSRSPRRTCGWVALRLDLKGCQLPRSRNHQDLKWHRSG